ncbi:8-oxo-dGTP diphosphatase [Caloramator quimbayensis]|uniref:8-oxo-dGTP diphosphatase n=1 Tax=Caloramator quimbayensis TaxID=1147123 RepID=A0A1T4XH19_9CLOT|nr:(deoxy)nucleoside triphosphate pyrophosphohydrolase [Caloramator quimbayensis]SKA88824.1 8-oxo-dGTP diphosphatase [Caloramator quimbayensis]
MEKEQKIIKVACAIIENEGKILAAQRSERMILPLKWEFPGGKVNEGEEAEECIVREIKEELDINIGIKKKLNSYIHDYDNISIELIPFVCYIISGQIKLKEHKDIIWDYAKNLLNIDWAAADVNALNEYINL